MSYKVTFHDDTNQTIPAHRMQQDGSGLYLFDAADNQIAYFGSGIVKSVFKVADGA